MIQRKFTQPPLIPDISDWPINKLSVQREAFVDEVVEYTMAQLSSRFAHNWEKLITRTIYLEEIRVKENPWKADPPNEKIYWKKLRHDFDDIADEEEELQTDLKRELVEKIVRRYTEEIVGNFNIRTFKFARKFLTAFFSRLLKTASARNWRRILGSSEVLDKRLRVYGPVERIRELYSQGTLVVLPTHFSNLDSILIGFALDRIMGLPSFSYGAGLNLFDSEIISFFMNRLGAYRVDRRKKNPIYLETLKSMSSLSIQRGTNSIFFLEGHDHVRALLKRM